MPNVAFDPPPGLFTDDTPFSDEGLWRTGSNVRFFNGKPQVIGGWTISGLADADPGVPSKMFEWSALDPTTIYLAIGTSLALFVSPSGAGLFDITPTGLGTVSRWSLSDYGQTLLASPKGGKLYQWSNNTGVIAAEITQAPDVITRMLVTNERQVLAFGCNEEISGTFNGLCIRGSDLEDPTDWTTTTSNNAFEHILDGPGSIVTALHLGNDIAILTTTGLWLGQFIGDPSQTYRFDRVGSGCGCLGMDSAVAANGVLFWITPDYQFYSWAPGSVPLPLPCPLLQTFQGDINTVKATSILRTFAFYNAKFSEVWFCYPSGTLSTAQPTKYVAVSTLDGKWSAGNMVRTAMHQGIRFLYGISSAGASYIHESGRVGVPASPLAWSIASGGFYVTDAARDVMFREVWGDFEDQLGNVVLDITVGRYPLVMTSLFGSSNQGVTFTTSTNKKNLRLSGRIASLRLTGNDASGTTSTFMRLGKLTFDVQPTGKR